METRFILLGLGADPADYVAAEPPAGETETAGPLTYRAPGPDYVLLIVEFLFERGLELLIELPLYLLFGG